MTLSAIDTSKDINWEEFAEKLNGHSVASIVNIAQNAAKISVLDNKSVVDTDHINRAINDTSIKF
jgi:ATP-dependent 26S proteasome regulatory subunit